MPRSIRGRMILISALAILLSLLIAGWALAGALEGFVTRGLDQRLDSEITLLATAIDDRGAVERSRIAKVRGLLEAEPGWRWQICGPDGVLGSTDFPPLAAPHPPGPGPMERTAPPPPAPRCPTPRRIGRSRPRVGRSRACAFMPAKSPCRRRVAR
ncbi:hypothetical protein [Sphingomonas paucimobilis]|uniref:hypothetical protein n=1 Tax=Sphingomonas paucimobilis TaxID=13689 RepID=UPI000E00EF45|nr:hypothetical protein [Sphingomonas paucimobilis]SUJ35683.1 Uncharacterised protein [Sphingomonas paucimobilis]